MIRRRALLVALLALGALAAPPARAAAPRPGGGAGRPPNIVVVFSDEYDFSFLGSFGGAARTPHLDRLAAEGVRFTNAYTSSPVCNPSRFAALTGLYPSNCQTDSIRRYRETPGPLNVGFVFGVDRQTPSVARILSAAGYFTGFVGKWGVDGDPEVEAEIGGLDLDRNVDPATPDGDGRLRAEQDRLQRWIRGSAGFDWAGGAMHGNVGWRNPLLHHHHIEWMTRAALDFLDAAAARPDRPFYLHLCPTTVHGPGHARDLDADPTYTPGGRSERHLSAHPPRASIRARLEAAGLPVDDETVGMTFLDDQLGAVLARLEEMGVADETLVFVLPDHNVEPGKTTCYHQGCHVPVLARWPGRIAPGSVFDGLVAYVDLVPTVLEAAGARPPAPLDGASFLGALTRGERFGREEVYFEMYTARGLFTSDGFKYVTFHHTAPMLEEMKRGRTGGLALDYPGTTDNLHSRIAIRYFPHYFDLEQLYDLAADPWEQRNLAAEPAHRERTTRMRARLLGFTQRFPKPLDAEIDPFYQSEAWQGMVRARRARDATFRWWNDDFRFREEPFRLVEAGATETAP